jgi:hypothetical protein
LRRGLPAVLFYDLRLGHPVNLGPEHIQETQNHHHQVKAFIPVPDPFPNCCSYTAKKLRFPALTQELQKEFFIKSPLRAGEMNTARLAGLNPELVRQLLFVMANVGLEKAAMSYPALPVITSSSNAAVRCVSSISVSSPLERAKRKHSAVIRQSSLAASVHWLESRGA